jgi:hypothetical protein
MWTAERIERGRLGHGSAQQFLDSGLDIALDLVDSRADSKGATIQVYRRPAGPEPTPTTD